MTTRNVGSFNSLDAGEDLSGSRFYIGQLTAAGLLELGEGATDLIIGVIENNDGGAGAAASYQHQGIAKVKLGGTVGIGAWVTSNAAGEGIATTTNLDVVLGRALEAGVAGDIIAVQLGVFTLSTV